MAEETQAATSTAQEAHSSHNDSHSSSSVVGKVATDAPTLQSRSNDGAEVATQDDANNAETRGRSAHLPIADDMFAKRAVKESSSRSSSLSASLVRAGSRPGSPTRDRLSPAIRPPNSAGPDSGTVTPAGLSPEEQIARLKHKLADLDSQVTSLNGKLVASYNRVGNLEDDIDGKSREAKDLAAKVDKLEAERKIWEDKYEGGLLVEKDHVQTELTRMMDRVIEETASRGKAENDKATIERELAELSSQLFAEANSMVAIERKERLKAERKMEELEQNFRDTESMMLGQSTQMRELGNKLEEIEHERDELKKHIEELQNGDDESIANASTISIRSDVPGGTPAMFSASLPDQGSLLASSVSSQPGFFLQMPLAGNAPAPTTPGTASSNPYRGHQVFAHPIQMLSFDVSPFQEFVAWTKAMARVRRSIMARPVYNHTDPYGYSSFSAPYAAQGLGHTGNFQGYMSVAEKQQALKEALQLSQYTNSPFIARVKEEDSDPSLRLEAAPGLSFFSRRQIGTAIIDGDIAIEPAYTSLPSDKCSMCGTSLEKFIASHQVTQPKDDPRKKLTRLATGWIPQSISGVATPTREAQDKNKDPWPIAALTDALGALTPSRELGGFSFGSSGPSEKEKAAQGHYTPYVPSASRPSTSGGRPSTAGQSRGSFGAGSAPDRKVSLPPLDRKPSLKGKAELDSSIGKDGMQHDYVLTQTARQQGQIYLFRVGETTTRYTLCPHYCLPRLRAVCELWNYIRHIHKGLLTEDMPKIYPSSFGSNNDYTKLIRRLTNSLQPAQTQTAGNVIQSVKTPAPGASKQLHDAPGSTPVSPPNANHAKLVDSDGFVKPRLSLEAGTPPIFTTTNVLPGLDPAAPMGLGLNMTSPKDQQSSYSTIESIDGPVLSTKSLQDSDDKASAAPEPSQIAAADNSASSNTAPPMPARPPRSNARAAQSSEAKPEVSAATAGESVNPPASTQDKAEASAEHDQTPMQSPHRKASLQLSSTGSPTSTGQSDGKASGMASGMAVPKSPQNANPGPPPLPARSPRPSEGVRQSPGKLVMPPRTLTMSSVTDNTAISATPGPASASATSANSMAAGPISSATQDWQQKCWYEVIRLKEGVQWARVGANYNKD